MDEILSGIKRYASKYEETSFVVHLKEGELQKLVKEMLDKHLDGYEMVQMTIDLGKVNLYLTRKRYESNT